jgi:predicted acetyltransferase/ribosomal protein S18 acetylase RimI-like enzyme
LGLQCGDACIIVGENTFGEQGIMNIKLVKLTYEYKQQLTDMMDEWLAVEQDVSPYAIFKNDYHDFDNYLENLELKEARDGLVPDSTFFCLDFERNIFVGAVNIRHYLNEKLSKSGGHIGDGIRPSERRKGYATAMIGLALEECRKLGINKILMTCDKTNIGSAKSIMNNGGVLESEFEENGKIEQRYWIALYEKPAESGRLHIRAAQIADAKKLLAIYAPYVRETAITFEYEVPTVEEFAARIAHTLDRYPYLVAEYDGEIVGYAYAGPLHERPAYDWAVETSIYIRQYRKGQGIGRTLYDALEEQLRRQNIVNVNACIASPVVEDMHLTKASILFHEKLGYQMVGEFHQCGYKFDTWYNMVWMEKMIGKHSVPQPQVIWFSQLDKTIVEPRS